MARGQASSSASQRPVVLRLNQVMRLLMIAMTFMLIVYLKIAMNMNSWLQDDVETNSNRVSKLQGRPNKQRPQSSQNNHPTGKRLNSKASTTTPNTQKLTTETIDSAPKPNISTSTTTTESERPQGNVTVSSACFMDPECITKTAKRFARAFPDRFDRDWIIPSDSDATQVYEGTNYSVAGILYVKNFKAASTTTAGAAFRIAYQVFNNNTATANESLNNTTQNNKRRRKKNKKRDKPAWIKAHHSRGNHYSNRYPEKSFLFTSVREPASRAMSRIFYTSMTQKGEQPTDQNILSKLRWNQMQFGAVSHMGGGYQVHYISMHKKLPTSWMTEQPNEIYNPEGVHTSVKEIFQDYDFILVAERYDESIVTMALLLGIDVKDVLVQSAKVGASSKYLYFTTHKKGIYKESCKPYVKTFVSPTIQQHLDSQEWHAKNYGDYLLYAAANLSLDMTIERIGRQKVEAALREYKRLSQMAKLLCTNETIYHCSEDGTPQRQLSKPNCYEDDSGCGYPCVDRMLKQEEDDTNRI